MVQSHPVDTSYNAALMDRAVQALADSGSHVDAYRLAQGETPPAQVVSTANRLVLVYPTWAAGMPAQMLHWLHTVLDQPELLANTTRLDAITTHGSSRFVNWAQGPWGKRYLRTPVLKRCAPSARLYWHPLYKVDRLAPESLTRHLNKLEARLAASG